MLTPRFASGNQLIATTNITSVLGTESQCGVPGSQCQQSWTIDLYFPDDTCAFSYTVYDIATLACAIPNSASCPEAGITKFIFLHTFASDSFCGIVLSQEEQAQISQSASIQTFQSANFNDTSDSYLTGTTAFLSLVVETQPELLVRIFNETSKR